MAQYQATLIGQGVSLNTPNSVPGTNGYVPSWNTDGTFAGWVAPTAPAGAGTELQFRSSSTAFGAVTSSSVSGPAVTLAGTFTVGSANIVMRSDAGGQAFVFQTTTGSVYSQLANNTGFHLSATSPSIFWYSGFVTGSADLGITRHAAGVLRLTNGSTDAGKLLIGTSSDTSAGLLHVATSTTATGLTIFEQASADTDCFDFSFRKARGTVASPTAISSGDELGNIIFRGYSGAAGYVTGAAIKAITEGTIATTRVPAYLSFWTGTNATPTVLTERMRITSTGHVYIGSPADDLFAIKSQGNGTGIMFDASGSGIRLATLRQANTDAAEFRLLDGGAEVVNLTSDTSFIFNEQGSDLDFRIEGDTISNLFFLDAGTDCIGIGQSTFGTSAKAVIAHANGTAPGSSPADCYQLYSADQTAGNACPFIRTENGSIVKLFQASHINDPSGGGTQDAEARTAIGSILDLLEANGLMAT